MAKSVIPLKSLLPTAAEVLDADLETLGGALLKHLKSCEGISPIFQHGGLSREYFLAIMERRNIGLGTLPSNEPEYGAAQTAVSQAFVEAWDWLVRDGLLIRNHQQPAEFYLITRRGEKFLMQDRSHQDNRGQTVVAERWDAFISHASEDKLYVDPLALALRAAGVSVWYDAMVLNWGDDLRPMIDKGLVNCRFGIVVLSKAFLSKRKWTEHELNGLFAREKAGRKLVLPIWHGITRDDLLEYSPSLADRLAKIAGSDSYDDIVRSLLGLLGRPLPDRDAAQNLPEATATADTDKAHQNATGPRNQISKVDQRAGRGVDHLRDRGRSQPAEDLNPREIELLWTTTKDPHGEIVYSETFEGKAMRCNGRQFLEGADTRTGAEWLGALRRLEDRGFIEPLSSDRDLFKVTDEGYEAADGLDGFARWRADAIVLRARYFNGPSKEQSLTCMGIVAIPARYYDDQSGADGSVVRSLRERRSLIVEGVDQEPPDGWQPTEVEFVDQLTGQVEHILVDEMQALPRSRLKLSIVE